jgi:hypothetical protein
LPLPGFEVVIMEQDKPVSEVSIGNRALATRTGPFERHVYLFRCASSQTPQLVETETPGGWEHARAIEAHQIVDSVDRPRD